MKKTTLTLKSRGETPEFTHNIAKLANKCEVLGIELPQMLDDISDTLTTWNLST